MVLQWMSYLHATCIIKELNKKLAIQQLKDYANFMKKITIKYYAVKILLMI